MAELLNCTEQHYQKIEYGNVNVPATTVIFLADYFDVTADYLLGREDEKWISLFYPAWKTAWQDYEKQENWHSEKWQSY